MKTVHSGVRCRQISFAWTDTNFVAFWSAISWYTQAAAPGHAEEHPSVSSESKNLSLNVRGTWPAGRIPIGCGLLLRCGVNACACRLRATLPVRRCRY